MSTLSTPTFAVLSCCSIVLLVVLACGDKPGSGPRVDTAEKVEVKAGLFLIGNDHGMIRPCGCAKPVLGGIERRGAFFEGLPEGIKKDSLILAFGDLIIDAGRQQEMKLETFMQAMSFQGVKALAPGDGDLAVGTSAWANVKQLAEFPFVSINLMKNDLRLFDAFAAIAWRDRQVFVTGYVSPTDNKLNEPGVVAEAAPDVEPLLTAMKKAKDAAVLVFYSTATDEETRAFLSRSGLEAAAARTLVVLRTVSDLPTKIFETEKITSIEIGQKGRDVAWTDWPSAASAKILGHTLDESVGSDAMARELLSLYRESVDAENLLEQAPRFQQAEGAYAGDQACQACHPESHKVWAGSGHSHALATLVKTGDQRDPECVSCHVVDFGYVGGFDPVTMTPANVQCEACHGPSAEHAATPEVRTPRGTLGRDFCFKCHDLANSPNFDFDEYWPRIAHSGK